MSQDASTTQAHSDEPMSRTFAPQIDLTDAAALLDRLLALDAAGSTDLADGIWREPATHYLDPERWRREIAAIHRRVPLPLALSCELPVEGSFKATDVAGTPVLITRLPSGRVHAMINSCRHRGTELSPPGNGCVGRFTCPFHGWSYDLAGGLVHVPEEATFGGLDRATHGLVALPAAELAGIVFVGLTPGAPLDLDAWIEPGLRALLEALDLARCEHYSTRTLDGPNWKIVLDGYLESYHVSTTHHDSVFASTRSNLATFDRWGAHLRNTFALNAICEALTDRADLTELSRRMSPVLWLFPGMNISGGWGDRVAVSIVLPGPTWDTSRTEQHMIFRHPVDTEERRAAAERSADTLLRINRDEDYVIAASVQRGLVGGAGSDVLFGRNEPAVQHFHRLVDDHLEGRHARDAG